MPTVEPPAKPAWYRKRLSISAPPASTSQPAGDRDAALARLSELTALDADIAEEARTRLLEPDQHVDTTVVIWHGFTNAPVQFAAIGEVLASLGYRVLLPRMPHHGLADRLTRDLRELTEAELVAHADNCVDIAEGLGPQVWVVGLSAGGTMAAWAAATRSRVSRVAMMAPLVAPKGFPMPVVRTFIKFPRIVPKMYLWWDSKTKAELDPSKSPYAYPGFPLPGVMPYLHLSEALFDHSVPVEHTLERAVVVVNPSDVSVRQDAAQAFATTVFASHATEFGVATIDAGLNWEHDFVDPWSPSGGTPEQVAAVTLAALGAADPSAGGLLVPPLVSEQP